MNSLALQLKKGQKKAISPVIATIILIAVALVLALVVGVFAFGLFSSNANTVKMDSGTLSGTTFSFSLSNPSHSALTITAVTVNGGTCTGFATALGANSVLSTSCTATGTSAGNNYNYDIALNNGQAITGVVVGT